MSGTKLLLQAYYETLYQRLQDSKNILTTKIEKLLRDEIAKHYFGDFDEDKYQAYLEASLAFVDERIETYNPIGFQYTFDRSRAAEAFELELQLNWYDGRAEFVALTEAASNKAEEPVTDGRLQALAGELIKEVGAFPDKSIISAYLDSPAVGKLPDYVVARAIEEIIR